MKGGNPTPKLLMPYTPGGGYALPGVFALSHTARSECLHCINTSFSDGNTGFSTRFPHPEASNYSRKISFTNS